MKRIPVLFFITTLVISACSNSDKKEEPKKDKYEQTKESVEEMEKKTPIRFITVTGHDKRNLLGQTVVRGTLNNTATVAHYKDVQLKLSFYSKTGALLEEDAETIFESVAPGESTDFKTKYFAPKGTDSVALKVMGAKSE